MMEGKSEFWLGVMEGNEGVAGKIVNAAGNDE
jgi:hypothetical protein